MFKIDAGRSSGANRARLSTHFAESISGLVSRDARVSKCGHCSSFQVPKDLPRAFCLCSVAILTRRRNLQLLEPTADLVGAGGRGRCSHATRRRSYCEAHEHTECGQPRPPGHGFRWECPFPYYEVITDQPRRRSRGAVPSDLCRYGRLFAWELRSER